MDNTIPRGSWLEDDAFRELVKQVAPLRPGGWSLPEFERATSALGAHARTAARMLVEELQNLGIDPADLVHNGSMAGRGRDFHLDLPGLGLPRTHPDA